MEVLDQFFEVKSPIEIDKLRDLCEYIGRDRCCVLIREDFNLLYISQVFLDMWGYSIHEFSNKKFSILDLVIESDQLYLYDILKNQLEVEFEVTCVKKDGDIFSAKGFAKNFDSVRVVMLKDISVYSSFA